MNKLILHDGVDKFEVGVCEVQQPSCLVLFATGRGGNPERHAGLIESLAAQGAVVVAPHFPMLASTTPSQHELIVRARRLNLALDARSEPGLAVAGVGHSIGATILLALAGGQIWMGPGQPVAITLDPRLKRLALLAPVAGFFRAPHALDAVHTPLLVWTGGEDKVTPPEQAAFLKATLGSRVPVDFRVTPSAGHFSFMNAVPPHVTDPMPTREAFLTDLANEVGHFVQNANSSQAGLKG